MSVSSTSSFEQQWLSSVAHSEKITVGEETESRTLNVHRANYISKDTLVLTTCQLVVAELEKKVDAAIRTASQMPLVLDPLKLAFPDLKENTDLYIANPPELAARTGLNNDESKELALRIQRLVIGLLGECKQKGMFEFTSKASRSEWKLAFTKSLFETLYERLNFTAQELPEEQQGLSCFQFAVLNTNEVSSNSWASQAGVEVKRLLTKLKALGYRPVKTPKENDLAIYFVESSPLPQHMGIYKGNGMVLSKQGIRNLAAHLHPAFSAHPHYGRMILFMSKQ
jgi:hypothetical protein